MAGIGFRLQKMLSKGTYRSLAEAYFYGALISSGPWLVSVIGIALLGILSRQFLLQTETELFRTLVVYTYMGTLVLTGPFFMTTTRYLADKMYEDNFSCVLPTFRYVAIMTLTVFGLIATAFYFIGGLETPLALGAIVLFQAVALTWAAMIFLSAARDYLAIARTFAYGYGIAVIAGYIGAMYWALPGILWGFALGMAILAILLCSRVAKEFPSNSDIDYSVRSYWTTRPWLAICGFAYNAALWVDKVIYWIVEGKKSHTGPFYAPTDYDTCFFLAYLTIVPAMALFLIRVETSFYKCYAELYGSVTGGSPLKTIEQKRQDICGVLRLSIVRLLKLQGGISFFAIIFAQLALQFLNLPPYLTTLLRIAILTAFLQAMFQIEMIIILYFDWQKAVARMTTYALILNIFFTIIVLQIEPRYQGYGCLFAFLIPLLGGIIFLENKLKDLIYETFAKQHYQ